LLSVLAGKACFLIWVAVFRANQIVECIDVRKIVKHSIGKFKGAKKEDFYLFKQGAIKNCWQVADVNCF